MQIIVFFNSGSLYYSSKKEITRTNNANIANSDKDAPLKGRSLQQWLKIWLKFDDLTNDRGIIWISKKQLSDIINFISVTQHYHVMVDHNGQK